MCVLVTVHSWSSDLKTCIQVVLTPVGFLGFVSFLPYYPIGEKASHAWLGTGMLWGTDATAYCPFSDDRRLLLPLPLCCVDGGLWGGQTRDPEEE